MSYTRIVPRDLFNDANLLKCLGQLYLNIDNVSRDNLELSDCDGVTGFPIEQDEGDGSTYCPLVKAIVNGDEFRFHRPTNARQPWPLYMVCPDNFDYDEIPVFTDGGQFHPTFLAMISGEEPVSEAAQDVTMRSFINLIDK